MASNDEYQQAQFFKDDTLKKLYKIIEGQIEKELRNVWTDPKLQDKISLPKISRERLEDFRNFKNQ